MFNKFHYMAFKNIIIAFLFLFVISIGLSNTAFSERKKVTTTIRAYILSDGSVDRSEIERSSGFIKLDELALKSILKKKFAPSSDNRTALVEIDFENINFDTRYLFDSSYFNWDLNSWNKFHSKEGSFTVLAPGEPAVSIEDSKYGKSYHYSLTRRNPLVHFSINCFKTNNTKSIINEWVEVVLASFELASELTSAKIQIISESNIVLDKKEGTEIIFGNKDSYGMMRVFQIDRNIYFFSVIYMAEENKKYAKKFLDSIKFQK